MFKGLSIADQCLVYRCLYYCYGLTPIPDYEYDMLEKEGKKYKTRNEFAKGSPSAYTTSRNRKLLDKIFPKK